jgi:hypothetical protein
VRRTNKTAITERESLFSSPILPQPAHWRYRTEGLGLKSDPRLACSADAAPKSSSLRLSSADATPCKEDDPIQPVEYHQRHPSSPAPYP